MRAHSDQEQPCGYEQPLVLPRRTHLREKKLTNMRASGTDESERLIPPKKLNMEGALEFCREHS